MKAWIARDKDKHIFMFFGEKPTKDFLCERWNNSNFDYKDISEDKMPEGVNPKWSDAEPIEVNVNITKASDDVVTISKDHYEQLLQYEQEYKQRQSLINSMMQNK